MELERLQKVMAQAGIASRRQCERLILEGLVRVNGQIVKKLGTKVHPLVDEIFVAEKRLQVEIKKVFLFHKPIGVITSMSDPQGRKTVADFFHHVSERVYPVGRLDYNTSGLLLITNDGELANRLTHPRYKIEKHYVAEVKGIPSQKAIIQLRQGVKLHDGWTQPAKVERIKATESICTLRIVIREGRNRQVRRMCEAIGHPVIRLKRDQIGFLTLKGLKQGTYRQCKEEERIKLYQMVNFIQSSNRM
ncbi:23S rRNA pseudouridine2605 synthase [Seinonella peptonophila]|uniref:Pseudouridine synthase n=1 Tax=Seinonella peptonophila TaxID=112248 RepID=A0A1M4TIL1_9BACL|nr:pseudouridine synthase [Seinonella peptonophila]SHE44245.1 23S rRNA pseudouridine2605 synthase [Seinonella peptonophila]